MRKAFIFILIIAGAVFVGYYFGYDIGFERATKLFEEKKDTRIETFENCVDAGFVVMESYPRQCRDDKGNTFSEHIGNELEKVDIIRLDSPRPNQVITSPLTITGEARGTWYFEASFPIILVDWDGRIIAQHYAQAQDEWMTENFVPFVGALEFEKPYDDTGNVPDFMKRGSLILQKDNPSGLPQFDDALEIPILFE
ncbi:MAG: Gmad2 immunoglobulin-like domain-containing protein [bacterium]|nr:Gmad2 immunoglobulin-like domain-containing protein [bacterium]